MNSDERRNRIDNEIAYIQSCVMMYQIELDKLHAERDKLNQASAPENQQAAQRDLSHQMFPNVDYRQLTTEQYNALLVEYARRYPTATD